MNSEHKAIWYLCPESKIDADEYITIMKKFQNDLRLRNIDPSSITFQQDWIQTILIHDFLVKIQNSIRIPILIFEM